MMPPTPSPEQQLQTEEEQQELSSSSPKDDDEGIPELILPTPPSMIKQQPHHNRNVSIETTSSQSVDLSSLFNNLHQTHHQRQVQQNKNKEETMVGHDDGRVDGNDSPDSGSLSLAASQVDFSLADDDLEGIAMGSDHNSNGSNSNEATTDAVQVVLMSGSHDLDTMINVGEQLFRESLVVADNDNEEEEEKGNDDENTKNSKDKTTDAINTAASSSLNNDAPTCTITSSLPSSSSDDNKSSSSKTTTIGRARMMMIIFAVICIPIVSGAGLKLLLSRYTSDTTTVDRTTVVFNTDIDIDIDIDIDAADRHIMYPVSNHSSKFCNNEECMNNKCHSNDNDDVMPIAIISSDTKIINAAVVGDGGAIMKGSTITPYFLALNSHTVFDFAWPITLLLVTCGLWWGLRLVWISSSSSSSASTTTKKNEGYNAKTEPTTPTGRRCRRQEGSFLTPPSLFKNSMVEPIQYMSPCYGDDALDISRYEALKSDELRSLLRHRKGDTTGSKSKLIRKLVTLYQAEFACLTVHQLRPKLRRRNLLQGGNKEDIIRRLVEAGPI